MISVATTLLNQGYKAAFVAGVLGNIMNEGNFGYFESSAYTSNPENEPSYLKYMDDHYNYRQLFSGKSISQVGVAATYDLVQKIIHDKVTKTASFGLGAIQWTWDRMVSLVNCYVQVCGQNSYPTEAQCIQVENQMVSNELNGNYNSVYTNWLSQYSDNANGAYGAGSVVCNQYESPDPNAGGVNQAEDRGKNAQNVYNVMMDL